MDKLKPCPFCGGKAYLIKNVCEENDYIGYKIYHSGFNCSFRTIESDLRDTEEEAIKSWNRRGWNDTEK